MNCKYIYAILAALIGIGTVLRSYGITYQCLSSEEIATKEIVQMTFIRIWDVITTTDFTPPTHYWIVHGLGIVFGYSTFVLRFPSLIFGILAIPAAYWLGKTYKDDVVGIVNAGVVTILYSLIYYSNYARTYTLVFLAFLIALTYFIKMRRGETTATIPFSLACAACVWAHLYASIPIILMILVVIIRDYRSGVKTGFLAGVLCFPLIIMPVTLLKLRVVNMTAGMSVPFGNTYAELVATTAIEFFNNTFPFMGLLIVCGVFIGRNDKLTNELFTISVITIAIGFICCMFTPFYPRYYLVIVAILLLLVSVPISEFMKMFKSDLVKIAILATILLFFGIWQNEAFISHTAVQQYSCITGYYEG